MIDNDIGVVEYMVVVNIDDSHIRIAVTVKINGSCGMALYRSLCHDMHVVICVSRILMALGCHDIRRFYIILLMNCSLDGRV